jgi:hypothetical protein
MRLAAVTHSAALGGRHAAWVGASSVLPSPPDRARRETHAHRAPVPADPSRAAAAGSAMRLPVAAVTHSAALVPRPPRRLGRRILGSLPSPPDRARRETHAHRAPVPADPSRAAAAGSATRLAVRSRPFVSAGPFCRGSFALGTGRSPRRKPHGHCMWKRLAGRPTADPRLVRAQVHPAGSAVRSRPLYRPGLFAVDHSH